MALQSNDLLLVQDSSNNSLHKTTIAAISQYVQTDDLGVIYRGKADFTAVTTGQLNPETPETGDFYVNDTAGTADASWAGLPTTVTVGDFAIYNGTTSSWDHITGEAASGGQVDSITASLPLQVDTDSVGSSTEPHLTIQEAGTITKGVVERLANAADVATNNPTPSQTAVVTANLLNATNILVKANADAIAAGGGGGGGGIAEAPQDGKCYVRQNAAWVDAATKYVVKNFSSYPTLP